MNIQKLKKIDLYQFYCYQNPYENLKKKTRKTGFNTLYNRLKMNFVPISKKVRNIYAWVDFVNLSNFGSLTKLFWRNFFATIGNILIFELKF